MDIFAIAYMLFRRVFFDAIIQGLNDMPHGLYSTKAARRLFRELAAKNQQRYRQRSLREMADCYVLKTMYEFYTHECFANAKLSNDEELYTRIDVSLLPFYATTSLRKHLEVPATISFAPEFSLLKAIASNNTELQMTFDSHENACFDFLQRNTVYMEYPEIASSASTESAAECDVKRVIFSVPAIDNSHAMMVVVRCHAGTNWIIGWVTASLGAKSNLTYLGYNGAGEPMSHIEEAFAVLSTCVALHLERLRIQAELALIPPVQPKEAPMSRGKARRRKMKAPALLEMRAETLDPFEAINLTADDLFQFVPNLPKTDIVDDYPDFTADLAALRAPVPQVTEANDDLIDALVVEDDGHLYVDTDGSLCNRKTGVRYRTHVDDFWRNQPYGPRNSLRRMQLIRGYWRGPEDGPVKTKVYEQVLDSDYMPVQAPANSNKRRRKLAA